ncbi:MAG: dihydrofolate synthase, partial [Cyanobacteriota bacterium]|nr:dihydrofolate synthase [Cyanobacteriota bacterium]
MDLSLKRMQLALKHLQSPAGSIPAVQVVGTNGKGSIACLIHHGLMAAGLRSGLTTSPHLVSWCERIRVDDALIRIETLRRILESLQPVVEEHCLTPFEQLICAALVHFDQQQPDWLVLEAGLGGRLDATTAHPRRPLIAVASIGLDHREHLGPTLQAIAAEKAAAIGPGAHVVSGPQEAAV